MSEFIAEVELKQGIVLVYSDYAVARFNEGANLLSEDAEEILTFAKQYFDGPFCWLSDKRNSYSLDPSMLLSMIKELPNLIGIAQTTYGNSMKDHTKLAEVYLPGDLPYKSFERLEEAQSWIQQVLLDYSSSSI